jgi:hypothetical protein
VQSATSSLPNAAHFSFFKLDDPNYLDWVSQFIPILRGHELIGIMDGSEPCPPKFLTNPETQEQSLNHAYTVWQKKDQHLLSWIICLLEPFLVSSMYGIDTAHGAWSLLSTRYAAQSRSRISHLKRQLQSIQQGSKSCNEYLQVAKKYADQLAAVGKPLEDDDLISFIISGLNPTVNTFITAFSFAVRKTEMSFVDFQSELLSHETLLENQNLQSVTPESGSFALYSNKQTNAPTFHSANRKPRYSPRTNSHHFSQQPRNSPPNFIRPASIHSTRNQTNQSLNQSFNNNTQHPDSQGHFRTSCQICGKVNHSALDCYHRMDYAYQGKHPPNQLAAMMAHTNAEVETRDWLADSGANAHITADATAISNPQPFDGTETVGVGNGAGLNIQGIGSSLVHSNLATLPSKFLLKDILYCPSASANLLSINKFCIDNHCLFELIGSCFTVKDSLTGTVLLQGPSRNGL